VAGVGQAVEELELRVRRERALLGLEPVTRAHLDDLHASARHSYIVGV
jgi:hypothetical protein